MTSSAAAPIRVTRHVRSKAPRFRMETNLSSPMVATRADAIPVVPRPQASSNARSWAAQQRCARQPLILAPLTLPVSAPWRFPS